MKRVGLFLVLLLFPLTGVAGEKVAGITTYVVDQQSWETGDGTGYWIWHGEGVQHSTEGPLGTNATECHGAGFWDKNGSWGEGICIIGAEDDTRTVHWKIEKGEEVGNWKDLVGTGRYAGMAAEGTYKGQTLPGGRRISEWQGEISMPN